MIRKGVVASFGASLVLVASVWIAAGSPGVASAASTTHKLSFKGPGTSAAIEGAVKGTFSCKPDSGAFSFKVSGVQPFEHDAFTTWPTAAPQTFGLKLTLNGTPFAIVLLTQDHKTGLFDGLLASTQPSVQANCATGHVLDITDYQATGSLVIDKALS